MLKCPTMPRSKIDRSLLEAALVGFSHKLGDVTLKIAEIKRMLGVRQAAKPSRTQGKRKPLSAAARARIGAAQKARWAAQKKQQTQTATPANQPTRKKRKISPAARKRMSEATRERWAEYRAKKAKLR